MAFSCEVCGHKTNEVKSGTGISEKGKKITLHVTDPSDLSRDILKVHFGCKCVCVSVCVCLGGEDISGAMVKAHIMILPHNPFTYALMGR